MHILRHHKVWAKSHLPTAEVQKNQTSHSFCDERYSITSSPWWKSTGLSLAAFKVSRNRPSSRSLSYHVSLNSNWTSNVSIVFLHNLFYDIFVITWVPNFFLKQFDLFKLFLRTSKHFLEITEVKVNRLQGFYIGFRLGQKIHISTD